MTNKTSTLVAAAAFAVTVAVVATGCSSKVPGNASPTTSASTGSSSTVTQNVFGNLNACQVLDQLVAGQGFASGKNISARNECDATKSGYGTYSLAFDPQQGLAEFSTSDPGAMETDVNGRNAMQSEPSPDMCVFAIEVTQHARALAQVTISNPSDYPNACPDAQQLAENLEPLLPKGQ